VSEDAWRKFDVKYLIYRSRKGKKLLFNLIFDEVVTYYQIRISQDMKTMKCEDLYIKMKELNNSILDPMTILDTGMSMDNIKEYNKDKVQLYLQSFLNLLKRNPIIEESLSSEAIVKKFFSKLQPLSFAQELLSLEIKSVQDAATALFRNMNQKDVYHAELVKAGKLSQKFVSVTNQRPTFLCANCEHNKNPDIKKNHKIWNCKNIEYCCKCNKKHMAFGPNCPFKDKTIFDFEKYLEIKNKKDSNNLNGSLSSNSKPSNGKNQSSQHYANSVQSNGNNNQPVNNVTTCPTTSNLMTSTMGQDILNQLALFSKRLEDLTEVRNVKKVKQQMITPETIIIDTGCNQTTICSTNHSDTPIFFNRKDHKETMQVANGDKIDIQGTGTILNHETNLVEEFTNTLLSVSRIDNSNNAIAIFTEEDCHIVKLDRELLRLLYKLLNKAKSKNSILLNGNVVNGLYVCDIEDIKKPDISKSCKLRYDNSQDKNKMDNTEVDIKSCNYLSFAGSSYYSNIPSVNLDSIRELVRYFHDSWSHASCDMMCTIVRNKLIDNLPSSLTVKAIRKHYPNCDSCATGNLQLRPVLSLPNDRVRKIGSEWELDLSGPMTDKQKKKCPSFSGKLWMLTCKDLMSRKRFGFLLPNKGYLLRYIKHLLLLCKQKHFIIDILRLDKEFITEDITEWCMDNHIFILPCIPHEHNTLGDIERDNRTIKENVIKNLANKDHLNERYWGMCYSYILDTMDIMPHPEDPSTTPYELWYGKKFDVLTSPVLPFGSIVKAHIPIKQQGMQTDKSLITYYVGFSLDKHGGILLYNPKTKMTITRRSFRVMGPIKQPESALQYEAAYDIEDQSFYNDDTIMTIQDDEMNTIIQTNYKQLPVNNINESSSSPQIINVADDEDDIRLADYNLNTLDDNSIDTISDDEKTIDTISVDNDDAKWSQLKPPVIRKSVMYPSQELHISVTDPLQNKHQSVICPSDKNDSSVTCLSDENTQSVKCPSVKNTESVTKSKNKKVTWSSVVKDTDSNKKIKKKQRSISHNGTPMMILDPPLVPYSVPISDNQDTSTQDRRHRKQLKRRKCKIIIPPSFPNLNNDTITTKNLLIPNVTDTYQHKFGNDVGVEHDPVHPTSINKIKQHIPQPVPNYLLAPDNFVVEKIVNHKGQYWRPSTLYLFVKWYGFDDSENS